jgi:hypothetical protein
VRPLSLAARPGRDLGRGVSEDKDEDEARAQLYPWTSRLHVLVHECAEEVLSINSSNKQNLELNLVFFCLQEIQMRATFHACHATTSLIGRLVMLFSSSTPRGKPIQHTATTHTTRSDRETTEDSEKV